MKFMLLGSGELGREFAIEVIRHGHEVIACDSYDMAPAMKVTTKSAVFDMLDGARLRAAVEAFQPDYIVPEIEAIATDELVALEDEGWKVVPCADAVKATMNRDEIRDIAHGLGIRTAKFFYAETLQELFKLPSVWERLGSGPEKCVVKPVMSSSGKGQSIVNITDYGSLGNAFEYALSNMRGDRPKVIIEEFIDFEAEYTLLSVLEKDGTIRFCDPIAHYQEDGDYRWSSHNESEVRLDYKDIAAMEDMATTIITDLTDGNTGAAGIFGVEFFVVRDKATNTTEVIFSELSPRPHDTGLVTLRSQRASEFKLHLKAILGHKITDGDLLNFGGASATLNATTNEEMWGIDGQVLPNVDGEVIVFNKPVTRPGRRMGVVLADTLQDALEIKKVIKL